MTKEVKETMDMKDYLESKGIYSQPSVPYDHFNIYRKKTVELEETVGILVERVAYLEDLVAKHSLGMEEISSQEIDALFANDDMAWIDEIVA